MRCGTDCIQQRDICDGWSDCKEDEDEQPAACAGTEKKKINLTFLIRCITRSKSYYCERNVC